MVTTPAEVRDRVRRLLIGGADVIKCIGTGAVLTRGGVPGAPELSEDEMRAAVEEAALYGRVRRGPRARRRGRAPGDPGRRPVRGARLDAGPRDDRDARGRAARTSAWTCIDGEWALEGDHMAGWPADTVRKMTESMETGHRGLPLGGRGRRPDHLLHRQRRLPARAGRRSQFDTLRAVRHGAARGDPLRDGRRRPSAWAGRTASGRWRRAGSRTSSRSTAIRSRTCASWRRPVVVLKGGRVAVDRRRTPG